MWFGIHLEGLRRGHTPVLAGFVTKSFSCVKSFYSGFMWFHCWFHGGFWGVYENHIGLWQFAHQASGSKGFQAYHVLLPTHTAPRQAKHLQKFMQRPLHFSTLPRNLRSPRFFRRRRPRENGLESLRGWRGWREWKEFWGSSIQEIYVILRMYGAPYFYNFYQ